MSGPNAGNEIQQPGAKVEPNGFAHRASATKPSASRQRRPNYAKLHAKPLPLETFPVPNFVPSNPLSLFYIAYSLARSLLWSPSSHPTARHIGAFSPETRSVIVTDQASARAFWESGFFGKGSLSRSEPNWLVQERRRQGLDGGLTSEEVTQRRRQERVEMKRDRARKEREAITQQLEAERRPHGQPPEVQRVLSAGTDGSAGQDRPQKDNTPARSLESILAPSHPSPRVSERGGDRIFSSHEHHDDTSGALATAPAIAEIKDEEHLQLTFEEAVFLHYALGVLHIQLPPPADQGGSASSLAMLQLFRQHSTFPPRGAAPLQSDDPFLVNYVAYHHYRSLGWVVRPGNKFAVDYLLYKGGPIFSHAEFAVVIIPSHSRTALLPPEGSQRDRLPWWWVHDVNRIQTQVVKTLVIAYVDIPETACVDDAVNSGDVGRLLKAYAVRDFIMRRWTPNRSRD